MGLENITVLVVENEESKKGAMLEGLHYQGFSAVSVSNAKEALELVSSYPVDLVVSSVPMPSKDGMLLLEKLKGASQKQTPFIFLSDGDTYEETEFLQKGVLKILPKSVNADFLHRTILDALDMKDIQLAP